MLSLLNIYWKRQALSGHHETFISIQFSLKYKTKSYAIKNLQPTKKIWGFQYKPKGKEDETQGKHREKGGIESF